MSQQARINSVHLLQQLRASLCTFGATASVALDEVATDIQRTLLWLREDRYPYWKAQVQSRNEQYVVAKLALKRKQTLDRALAGSTTSCVDEKKELQKAERRLREAEQKLGRARVWGRQIEKELSEYRGMVQGLVNGIETSIPNARADLDKMTGSLEAYIALAPPEMPVSAEDRAEAGGADSAAASAAVRQPVADLSPLQKRAGILRGATPSRQMREQTPIASDPAPWLAGVKFSALLHAALRGPAVERADATPEGKVVLAVPQGEPSGIYLERTDAAEGDSGWYLGPSDETDSGGRTAVRVSDLLAICPDLQDILSLPAGYLLLRDDNEAIEAVFDSRDEVRWTAEIQGSAPEE